MTTKEAALLWGVTPATVRRYCTSGRIKHCKKLNGRWIFNPLCHKPFDRRFKRPVIVVSYVSKIFYFNIEGQVLTECRAPLSMPERVNDGLIVIEAQEEMQKAA